MSVPRLPLCGAVPVAMFLQAATYAMTPSPVRVVLVVPPANQTRFSLTPEPALADVRFGVPLTASDHSAVLLVPSRKSRTLIPPDVWARSDGALTGLEGTIAPL